MVQAALELDAKRELRPLVFSGIAPVLAIFANFDSIAGWALFLTMREDSSPRSSGEPSP
ncbi:MAG: hypothetical protein II969_15795 [Anaerolineaceae bacterium]|nr:hypothetical protein [Anaerolineaceae bacterium]